MLGVAILPTDSPLISYLFLVTIGAVVAMTLISRLGLRYPNGFTDWTIGPPEVQKGEMVRITVTNLAPYKGEAEEEEPRDEKEEEEKWLRREQSLWKKPGLVYHLHRTTHLLSKAFSALYRSTWGQLIGIKQEMIHLEPKDVFCSIEREDKGKRVELKAESKISIPGQDSYTWLWPTKGDDVTPGVYRFTPYGRRGKRMRRKVIVWDSRTAKTARTRVPRLPGGAAPGKS